jgi:hypothetical protein
MADWAAVNVWVDAMTASAGLALQIGWAFWRHAQAQREAALRASAENLSLRLALLQGQLEPHFLFNTLNSISALVRGAERAVALQALNRLSDLLRYALRASQQRWVSAADELAFVDDYVALQRLRFGKGLQWQTEVDTTDWALWACPPLAAAAPGRKRHPAWSGERPGGRAAPAAEKARQADAAGNRQPAQRRDHADAWPWHRPGQDARAAAGAVR